MKTKFPLLCLIFYFASQVVAQTVELVRINNQDAYACDNGWTYLTYKDHTINKQQVCSQTMKSGAYRLLGGASITGSYYKCAPKESDAKLLAKAICVQTSFDKPPKVVKGDCPSDSATVSLEEVTANQAAFCAVLDKSDVVRVGFGGSLSAQRCELKDWADHQPTKTLCIKRRVNKVKIVDSKENICKSGQSLVTLKEALENREEYCDALPYQGTVRLAGGASMDGRNLGCKIHEVDARRLKAALCGDATRDTF